MTARAKAKPAPREKAKMVDTIWGRMTEAELHALQDEYFEDDEE